MKMAEDYQPGDRIIKDGPNIKRRVYVVCSPPRTFRGKLRIRGVDPPSEISTAWWRPPGRGGTLPKHYRWVPRG